MIVELYGLPGTGKSTIARALESQGKFKRIRITSKAELLWYNFLFFLKKPFKFFKLLFYIFQHSSNWQIFYYKFMNLFLHCNAKYQKALKYQNALIDQGYFQNVISLFEQQVNWEIIQKYLANIILPDKLFILQADDQERQKRLLNRGHGLRQFQDEKIKDTWLKASQINNSVLLENLYTIKVSFYIISNNKSLEQVLQEINFLFDKNILKISYIVNARIPTEKAHGYQICKMCEEFSNIGAFVELFYPIRNNLIRENLFDYYNINKNFLENKIKLFDFIKWQKFFLKKGQILQSIFLLFKLSLLSIDKNSIIYTRDPEIAWLFNKRGYRVFFEAHFWPISKGWLYKFLLKDIEGIICNSNGTLDEYQKAGLKNLTVAPNGVDLKIFEIKQNKVEFKQELNIPLNKKIIMYVGHLYEWKGVDIIIDTADLMKIHNDFLFILVGGTDSDICKYEKIIKEKKINNILLAGRKSKKVIPRYLKSADILLLPNVAVSKESIKYTSPIKIFEYMAARVPIIASDLPSVREIVDDSMVVFFQPHDRESLKLAIEKIFNDSIFSNRLVECSFARVKSFDWKIRAKNIINFINNG